MPIFDDDDLDSLDTALISELLQEEETPSVESVLDDLRDARTSRLNLGEAIARGGMGTVHVAADRLLQQKVAVKVLHRNLEGDAEAVQRFVHEARITAQLDHPNMCRSTTSVTTARWACTSP